MTSGSERSNGVRVEEFKKKPMDETLVRGQRRVVKSPISQIIVGAVPIPFLNWKVNGDLHPMSLSLIVPKFRRVASAGVRVQ